MKDKIIFLDFDGVITIPPDWDINIEKLKKLKEIIDDTDAKIVISSSWRGETIEKTKDFWFKNVKRCSKNRMLNWFVDNLYDVTPIAGNRGEEIQRWLDAHEVENYVILDDETDMLNSQMYHFVQTNWEFGLEEPQVSLAIKVLKNERIRNKLGLNSVINYAWVQKCNGNNELINKIDNNQDISNV